MSTLALVLALVAFAVAAVLSAMSRAYAMVALAVGWIVLVLALGNVNGFH